MRITINAKGEAKVEVMVKGGNKDDMAKITAQSLQVAINSAITTDAYLKANAEAGQTITVKGN